MLFTPMDHLPILCSLAGINIPHGKDGINLAGVLKNPDKDENRTVLIGNYVSEFNSFSSGTASPEWRGIYSGRFTYFKWLTGKEELYDNAKDPFQLNNLVEDADSSEIIKELRKKLNKLLAEAGDDFLPGTAYGKWFDENRNFKMNVISGKK